MSAWLATLLFEVVNFVVLASAIGWVFTKPMRKLLDDETSARAREKAEASEASAAAERARAELKGRLSAAEKEAEGILSRARVDARRESATLLEQAKAQIRDEQRRAAQQAEQRRRADVDELGSEVARVASALVLDVFARAGSEADSVLLRAAREDLVTMLSQSDRHVVVESARPLDDETRSVLRTVIGPALDAAQVRIVPELVAGVRVRCDAGLVDASARGLAATAVRALTAQGADRAP